MKKILITIALATPILGLHAQLYVGAGETVTVLEGTDVFFGGIDATDAGAGLLDIQSSTASTNCVVNGEITGDDRISFGNKTRLKLQNCTWTTEWDSPTENNEEIEFLEFLAASAVIVPPGNSLTVSGQLIISVPTSTVITLQADATGYGQLLTSGVPPGGAANGLLNNSGGTLLAEQFLSTTPGWRQLSFPVNGSLLDLDDDLTLRDASNSTEIQHNVFWYDATPVSVGTPTYAPAGGTAGNTDATSNSASAYSTANARHWKVAADNSESFGPNNNGRAWNIYAGGTAPTKDGGKIDVEGNVIGNASYTFDCYSTHDVVFEAGNTPSSVDENLITGWNLIPNPYPSNIDVAALMSNSFFTGVNAYAAVHVWQPNQTPSSPTSPSSDPTMEQYIAITNDGLFSHVNWNTGNGIDIGQPYIAPFQAFWVKTERTPSTGSTSVAKTLTLTNNERTVTRGTNYFKNTPPVIRLNVFDQSRDGYRDQAVLAFDPSSTEAIDANDAYKFTSPNEWVPSLYTKVDGSPMTINRLPNPDPAYSIPVYMDSKKDGEEYSFSMVAEDIDPNWTVFLEDVKRGKMHNLRNGEYSFLHDASMKTNRFVVHINKFAGNIDVDSWNSINIYADSDGINVAFANPDATTAKITISNLAGQLIYQGEVSTGRLFTFPINDDIALYAVQVVTGSKVTHDKVVK